MGWFAGSSTRTPTTRISLTRVPPPDGPAPSRRPTSVRTPGTAFDGLDATRATPRARAAGGAATARAVAAAAPAASAVRAARLPRAGEEHQPELADLHLVAGRQHRGVHRLAVHVGAVEAADVHDDELARVAAELGVAARDRHVVEEDVAVGMAARARRGAVQQEPGARVRAPLDHKQRRPRRQRVDARHGLLPGRRLRLGEEVGPEDRRRLRGTLRWHAGPVVRGHLAVSSAVKKPSAVAYGRVTRTYRAPSRPARVGPQRAGSRSRDGPGSGQESVRPRYAAAS